MNSDPVVPSRPDISWRKASFLTLAMGPQRNGHSKGAAATSAVGGLPFVTLAMGPSEEATPVERGTIHIISEIGGCVIGLPPDRKGITTSLRSYARRQGMEHLELLDPLTDALDEWAEMWNSAMREYGIEGPILVGTHQGDRVLLGVSKRHGYPGPGVSLDDIFKVVRYKG